MDGLSKQITQHPSLQGQESHLRATKRAEKRKLSGTGYRK